MPEDVDEIPTDYLASEEEEAVEEPVPPPVTRTPAFFEYIVYITESSEAPPATRQVIWPAFLKDIKLGNLRTIDEHYIRIGIDNFLIGTVRDIAHNGRKLTWSEFRELLGVRAVLPAILSRGRGGFERTMQNAQFTATITGGSEKVEATSVFDRVRETMSKLFGGGNE